MIKFINKLLQFLKKHKVIHTKDISDGYHTIGDLYEHRMLLTAALFNLMASTTDIKCVKSWKHHDGTMFDGMFIVMAQGRMIDQISYHYNEDHWDLFEIPQVENAPEWDGHTPDDVCDRLLEYCANF